MPYFKDSNTSALIFVNNEDDLPEEGNWTRLWDPDGYLQPTYDSLSALWKEKLNKRSTEDPEPKKKGK
jgi:hypothetical protein